VGALVVGDIRLLLRSGDFFELAKWLLLLSLDLMLLVLGGEK
jgi:hypothetical protein